VESKSLEGKQAGEQVAATVGAADKGSEKARFTFKTKGYDPLHRQFHRIESGSYDIGIDNDPAQATMTKKLSSGRGYDCGCRSPKDFTQSALFDGIVDGVFDGLKAAVNAAVPGSKEALEELKKRVKEQTGRDFEEELKRFLANTIEGLFFRSFLVHIPAWVPVNRIGYGPDFTSTDAHNVVSVLGPDGKEKKEEREVEVEGFLTRSYLTRHHRPYTQWSRYYHWSFQVNPAPGFKHLIGFGDVPSGDEANQVGPGKFRVQGNDLYRGSSRDPIRSLPSSLECLLDLGALSKPPGDPKSDLATHPSILFDQSWPFWPQSGDYFWATGRYVYDCTHATTDEKTGEQVGLHPTQINPVKAFAVARYEAFQFDGFDQVIPVTRFMFFATRKGGYMDFDDKSDIKINDRDYEFIVDLPPLEDDFGEFAVGRTPQFNMNTIVVRPRLLKNIEFGPFRAGFDSPLRFSKDEPIIQLVRPEPGKLPKQLRIKVPMSKMKSEFDAHCFVLTLGWLDDRQAARVKKVTVQVPELTFNSSDDHFRLNVCINGRWIFFPSEQRERGESDTRFRNVRDRKQGNPPADGLALHLPDDGKVTITAHGMRRGKLGDFIEEKPAVDQDVKKDRRLQVGGIIEIDDDTAKKIREEIEKGLGRQIPEGFFKDFDEVKKVLSNESIKKILGNAAADLFGQRRIVDWKRDVDSIEADATKQHQLASAIAREMKVFPVFNSANRAMGMVEKQMPRLGPDPVTTMKELVDRLKAKQPPLVREYLTMKTVHPEETGFIFVEEQNESDNFDYRLKCTIAVSEPTPNVSK
jgi:hypothetical protein